MLTVPKTRALAVAAGGSVKHRFSRPARYRDSGTIRSRRDHGAILDAEPHREHNLPRLPLGKRRPAHARLHGATVAAIAASNSSSMLHTVDAMPAAMAGVQRIVEWMRAKL